jgi:hypothetical protein
MQPRNLPVVEAELVDELLELELEPAVAELVLLPHPATTTIADTASAAVAHALCFTLTSTGPARRASGLYIHPGLSRRLCLAMSAGKGTRGFRACSLPNRNPIIMASLACLTKTRVSARGFWCFSTG